jgi:hypothetical protein
MPEKLKLEEIEDGLFACPSFTHEGKWYLLDLKDRTCSCPSYKYHGFCKHLRTVYRLAGYEA